MSDINPVEGRLNRIEGETLFKNQGKQLTADIKLSILRNQIDDLRLKNVDAGVHQLGKRFVYLRFFLERLDAPVIITDHHTVTGDSFASHLTHHDTGNRS